MANIEPLSNVDAAWLRMEDPTNLMMVSGILTFKEPLDYGRLREVIGRRLLQFDRFRMRVVQPKLPLAPAYWEYDPNFNLDAHVHRVALPEPGDKATLQVMVSHLMSTPLDFSKPLWMIHAIENYDGGTAVCVRLHHCIADGMALVFVLLSLTDLSPDAKVGSNDKIKQPRSRRGLLGGGMTSMLKQTAVTTNAARSLTKRALHEGRTTLTRPSRAVEIAQWSGDNVWAAGRLFLRSHDPDTSFKGKLGTQKRAAWSRPLSMKDVKKVKNATGGTVNDVLVGAMTGGLRRYLLARGEDVRGLSFRAAVPINLRQPDEMGTLGNKFGLLFLDLPVGIADPLDRLNEVHKRMEELKTSKEGPVGLAVLGTMGIVPQELQGTLMEIFGKKLTAVMTNVPGPPMPLYMGGRRIHELMFWVPQSGRLGLGISIISYAGKVQLGVATDAGLVPDPDAIIEGFYQEFDDLLALAVEAEAISQQAPSPEVEIKLALSVETAVTFNPNGDLQHINGIGPTYAARLEEAGIISKEQLLAQPSEKLAEILNASLPRVESILAEAQKVND
ncbi:MAG TPA: wax ester/triacylglycerol synthase family O-acyltransferase [Chloroflexota bacterium]|nr:wax ester/triacylglycerol synthase family O-acyltransferase [Chloroflexota bacterium]